jgi:hypothetical protein
MTTQIPQDDKGGDQGQEDHDVPDSALPSALPGDHYVDGGRS